MPGRPKSPGQQGATAAWGSPSAARSLPRGVEPAAPRSRSRNRKQGHWKGDPPPACHEGVHMRRERGLAQGLAGADHSRLLRRNFGSSGGSHRPSPGDLSSFATGVVPKLDTCPMPIHYSPTAIFSNAARNVGIPRAAKSASKSVCRPASSDGVGTGRNTGLAAKTAFICSK